MSSELKRISIAAAKLFQSLDLLKYGSVMSFFATIHSFLVVVIVYSVINIKNLTDFIASMNFLFELLLLFIVPLMYVSLLAYFGSFQIIGLSRSNKISNLNQIFKKINSTKTFVQELFMLVPQGKMLSILTRIAMAIAIWVVLLLVKSITITNLYFESYKPNSKLYLAAMFLVFVALAIYLISMIVGDLVKLEHSLCLRITRELDSPEESLIEANGLLKNKVLDYSSSLSLYFICLGLWIYLVISISNVFTWIIPAIIFFIFFLLRPFIVEQQNLDLNNPSLTNKGNIFDKLVTLFGFVILAVSATYFSFLPNKPLIEKILQKPEYVYKTTGDDISLAVQSNWNPPFYDKDYKLIASFLITVNGDATNIVIRNRHEIDALNQSLIDAIKKTKFSKPDQSTNAEITFTYNLKPQ